MRIADFPVAAARASVAAALTEDRADHDVTTLWSVPADLVATAEISTRRPGVVAGMPVVREVFAQSAPEVGVEALVADGERVRAGAILVRLTGSAHSLITAEMEMADIEEVTRMRAGRRGGSRILLEASGNVTLDRVRAIAEAGVDLISIGALTHSAPALDLTMLIATDAAPCPR